jgi:hypothetical protein
VTSRVKLPDGAEPPIEVFVNGVRQHEGQDYRLVDRELVFDGRLLKKEGRLGFWRWTSIFLGLVGSYRQNDSVDVHWTTPGGDRRVAVYLDIENDEDQP